MRVTVAGIRGWQWPTESNNQTWSFYNCTVSCPRTQRQPFYSHSAFETNWKGEKAQWVRASWADCKSKKNCHFEMSSSMQQRKLFLDWIVICDWKVDFMWQPAVTSSAVGLRRCYKPLPKAELKPKIGHGHYLVSAANLIHYSFLNPRETTISEKYAQQIHEMPWKLQCLQPTLVNRKSPVLLHDNTWLHIAWSALQKLGILG